ncbi:MAG: aminopeptidase P N-terminal domain-containing protein, partial [Actinomycetota bacterium]|nr:aminopeptidase P N-terminal domain-containing protein [Actinomycetota bacterium]
MAAGRATARSLEAADGIAAQLARRRHAVAKAWNLSDEIVLIGAGERVPVPGRRDRTYPFRAHSEYLYLTDRERPGGVLAFDAYEGWLDFVTPVTRDERLWEGARDEVQDGRPASELESWRAERRERPLVCLGAPVVGFAGDETLATELRYALNHVRRQKDELELARMRIAERATGAGFAAIQPLLVSGTTERQVQIELEAEFFRNGADFLAFETIVGGGPNAAVLHFPPSQRPFADGELILIDAGGEYRGYASDITRTYPVSGELTPEQAALYAVVRRAGLAAIASCTPGTEWRDVHRT